MPKLPNHSYRPRQHISNRLHTKICDETSGIPLAQGRLRKPHAALSLGYGYVYLSPQRSFEREGTGSRGGCPSPGGGYPDRGRALCRAYNSGWVEANAARVRAFLSPPGPQVLLIDEPAAEQFGRFKAL
jgi:hypothetical protein